MKIRNLIYTMLAGSTLFASCKKDFLNQTPPTSVPINSAIKTESDLLDATAGIYSAIKVSTLFGRDIPVLGDLLADNTYVSVSNSGRYLSENNYSFIATNGEALDIWSQGYYTILQANRVIYAANSLPASSNVSELKGEAYTLRALTYLELVNWFAQPYTVSSSAAGVPLVTTPTFVSGPFTKPPRSSVSAVYAKIISDLDSAYSIMPTTTAIHTVSSNFISKYAARAIEARAYLYKGDYANAAKAATDVIQNSGYSLATTSSAFTAYWQNPDPSTVESIFDLSMTATSSNGTNGLDYMYDQNGYGDLLATDGTYGIYNTYTSTDYRKSLITPGKRGGNAALIVTKYTSVLNTDRDEVKVIRYAEVILTAAEGYARTGDNVNGLLYLNMLAKLRDPAFAGYTDTGDALIADILNERRKELAFEGLRWFDLMRTNALVNRPQETYSYPSYPTVSTSDIRRILPIPQNEINVNKNITQNPGY